MLNEINTLIVRFQKPLIAIKNAVDTRLFGPQLYGPGITRTTNRRQFNGEETEKRHRSRFVSLLLVSTKKTPTRRPMSVLCSVLLST